MNPRKILVVEDDGLTRRLVSKVFTLRGWLVAECATVSEAVAELGLAPAPDCILLDLVLPDGDGEDVLREVRGRGLRSRVVVATAVEDPERTDAVLRLGAAHLLRKPTHVTELCRACGD